MPRRVPTYRPPAFRRRDEARPSSHERGYGSAAWRRLRLQVIARDEGVCRICGGVVTGRGDVDHIVPKAAGGTDALENLQYVHAACHSRKTVSESR
jgi:5-methylcytosine-specific restriction protein A